MLSQRALCLSRLKDGRSANTRAMQEHFLHLCLCVNFAAPWWEERHSCGCVYADQPMRHRFGSDFGMKMGMHFHRVSTTLLKMRHSLDRRVTHGDISEITSAFIFVEFCNFFLEPIFFMFHIWMPIKTQCVSEASYINGFILCSIYVFCLNLKASNIVHEFKMGGIKTSNMAPGCTILQPSVLLSIDSKLFYWDLRFMHYQSIRRIGGILKETFWAP